MSENKKPLPPFDLEKILNSPVGPRSQRRKLRRRRRKSNTLAESFIGMSRFVTTMTFATLLLKSGPVMILGLAGGLLCFRGCFTGPPSFSIATPQGSVQPQQQQFQNVAPVPFRATSPSPVTNDPASLGVTTKIAVSSLPIDTRAPEKQLEDFLTQPEFHQEDPGGQPFGAGFVEPKEFDLPTLLPTIAVKINPSAQRPGRGIFGAPVGPNSAGNIFRPQNSPMQNTLSHPLESIQPQSERPNPLFDFKRGRKFTGTSQQPGQPSMRIQLSISSIRNRGSNITVRLASLEGKRLTRNYNGLIESNPPRLALIPEASQNGFGTFLTYEPWHSSSPTKINLAMNGDKGLSGKSISGEIFELLADEETEAKPISAVFRGFDCDSRNATLWRVLRKNGSELFDETWLFASESSHFEWKRGLTVIASGSFAESCSKKTLDIVIDSSTSTKTYLGTFLAAPNTDRTIRVCIPREPDSERPVKLDSRFGNLYDLERIVEGE